MMRGRKRRLLLPLLVVWFTGLACVTLLGEPSPVPGTATASPPAGTLTPGASPQATTTRIPLEPSTGLQPIEVAVFPGPLTYAGDVLTLQLPVPRPNGFDPVEATVTIDGGEPFTVQAQPGFNPVLKTAYLTLPNVFDTRGAPGLHDIRIQVNYGRDRDIRVQLDVRNASERPSQETRAGWTQLETDCCLLHFITGTAAARDLEDLAERVETDVDFVSSTFDTTLEDRMEFVFIDILWGNGGYATDSQSVVSYIDRDYGPNQVSDLEQVVRHEATHLVAPAFFGSDRIPFFFTEGVPVFVAGGHFKPEPLRQRAAALLALGRYIPLTELTNEFGALQHETRYLQAGAVVTYLVETHGWDGFLAFLDRSYDAGLEPLEWFDRALQDSFGVTLEDFEADFRDWVQAVEPGDQLDDLRLTIELQEVRRSYQERYAPFYDFAYFNPITEVEQVAIAVREASAPENVAMETMLAQAQQAVFDGRYEDAERLIGAARRVLVNGGSERQPESDYLTIARILAAMGYEALSIRLDGDLAQVLATPAPPRLETFAFERRADGWVMVGP